MEPREDVVGGSGPERLTGDRTLGETLAATICGAVLGAGVLFAAAEVWARGAVEGAGGVPLTYVLAGIGALCGAAVVLAYLRSDAVRAASASTEAGGFVDDYVAGPVPLAPMAWQPVPVIVSRMDATPAGAEPPPASQRERIHIRQRRHRRPARSLRRVARHLSIEARTPQRPPAEA